MRSARRDHLRLGTLVDPFRNFDCKQANAALTGTPQFHISIFIESLEKKMQADRVIRALSALAQEHRLAAFRLLVQAGEQLMGYLTENCCGGMSCSEDPAFASIPERESAR